MATSTILNCPTRRRRPGRERRFLAGLTSAVSAALLTLTLAPAAQAVVPTTGDALYQLAVATHAKPLLGGWSRDYPWYNANVGPVQIYRTYDTGFQYPTWQQTPAYALHGNAPADYSFQIPPADVASGAADTKLTTFLASTPKNLILTNFHEPENDIELGLFTAQQFRDSIAHLATLTHAQNAADGGSRRVSVVLMYDTVYGYKARDPHNYWPGADPATGQNYADLISFDTYALPHNTNTTCCPIGFTDGIKWQTPQTLLNPSIAFAADIRSPWLISEFGYLDDITNPQHKATAITDFVNYARYKGAIAVEYWDASGTRANWQLRYGNGAAASAWKTIVNKP